MMTAVYGVMHAQWRQRDSWKWSCDQGMGSVEKGATERGRSSGRTRMGRRDGVRGWGGETRIKAIQSIVILHWRTKIIYLIFEVGDRAPKFSKQSA